MYSVNDVKEEIEKLEKTCFSHVEGEVKIKVRYNEIVDIETTTIVSKNHEREIHGENNECK